MGMLEFLKAALSGDGEPSSNRLCLFMVVTSLICWSSVSMYRTGTIPEIPESWYIIIGVFVTGSFGGKATAAYKSVKTPAVEEAKVEA